ncbi:MAG: ECF transporter S component [Bacillota bacterium]|jgi:uncharacterized membrane protein|nr:ECF transporter S component [Bacillota bacterium]
MKADKNAKTQEKMLYRSVFTALMAAIVFVTTMFFKIPIPTPVGQTMLKVGNVFCLLSGMLLGPVFGGLAAGIGSALYDLTDPAFTASAPFTLVFFFIMGFVCGVITSPRGTYRAPSFLRTAVGAAAGAFSYFLLYAVKSVAVLILAGSTLPAAIIACSTKLLVSLTNATLATVVSVLLAKPLLGALERNGLLNKLR